MEDQTGPALTSTDTTQPTKINEVDNEIMEEETALEKLIRIPLIFEKIAKSLSVEELKGCRRVNLGWREAATQDLIKMDALRTNLITMPPSSPLQQLKNLNDLLLTSHRFPSTDFHLRGPLNSEEFEEFFCLVGPSIRTLTLANTGNVNCKRKMYEIFQDQAPNIKKLKLFENLNLNWTPEEEMALPALRNLSISSKFNAEDNTIEKILISAPHLQTLDNVTSPWFNCLVKLKKTHLVQTLKWIRVDDTTKIDDLISFSKGQPKLKKCGSCSLSSTASGIGPIEETEKLLIESFLRILTSSAMTLEELELTPMPFDKLDLFSPHLPRFEKLETLKLRNCYNSTWCMFPLASKLTWSFPNLVTLDLHWYREWVQFFSELTPHDFECRRLPSVRNLECGDEMNRGVVRRLALFCPNVKKLKVHASGQLETFLPLVCVQWSSLEALELVEVPPYHSIMWDSALTGFSEDTCRKFLSETRDRRIENHSRFLRKPWIGILPNLRTLDIYVHGDNPVRQAAPFRLTHVSGLYAFECLPNLKVEILSFRGIDFSLAMKKALRSVAPFVRDLILKFD